MVLAAFQAAPVDGFGQRENDIKLVQIHASNHSCRRILKREQIQARYVRVLVGLSIPYAFVLEFLPILNSSGLARRSTRPTTDRRPRPSVELQYSEHSHMHAHAQKRAAT